MTPTRDPGGVSEWDVQPSQVDQESEMFDIRLAIIPIVVVPSRGPWKPARALVEADGVGRHSDLSGEFTDPHWRSKPWSRSDVKPSLPRVLPRARYGFRRYTRKTSCSMGRISVEANPASRANRSTVDDRMTVPTAADGCSARLFGRQTVVLTA